MNTKTASKARIYLYDEENIIKKITYIYDDGSESKPLTVFKHIGMFKMCIRDRDYTVHSALNTFVQNEDYHIKKAFVISNERKVTQKGKITYIPIYNIMFFNADWGNKNLQF